MSLPHFMDCRLISEELNDKETLICLKRILEVLNKWCYLASGDIPDLFSDEEVDMIVTSMRMELRGLGLIDSRDNCWSFFIERIRRQLKVGGPQCGFQSASIAKV